MFDAILHKEPTEAVRLNTAVPGELERIIDKAMEKDRELRYSSATELRTDLKRFKRDSSSGKVPRRSGEVSAASGAVPEPIAEHRTSSVAAAQTPMGFAWKQYALLAACVALLAAGLAVYHFWPRSNAVNGPAKITQISHWNKPMDSARLSSDGHTVAFTSPVGGIAQVFVMLTSGGEPLQLTNDEGEKFVNTFSPDGTEIYYQRVIGRDEAWAVPTLGGSPRRVASASYVVPGSLTEQTRRAFSIVKPRRPALLRQFNFFSTKTGLKSRRKSLLKAIWPSMRATGAPKQKMSGPSKRKMPVIRPE